jgi:hypothetical protein
MSLASTLRRPVASKAPARKLGPAPSTRKLSTRKPGRGPSANVLAALPDGQTHYIPPARMVETAGTTVMPCVQTSAPIAVPHIPSATAPAPTPHTQTVATVQTGNVTTLVERYVLSDLLKLDVRGLKAIAKERGWKPYGTLTKPELIYLALNNGDRSAMPSKSVLKTRYSADGLREQLATIPNAAPAKSASRPVLAYMAENGGCKPVPAGRENSKAADYASHRVGTQAWLNAVASFVNLTGRSKLTKTGFRSQLIARLAEVPAALQILIDNGVEIVATEPVQAA